MFSNFRSYGNWATWGPAGSAATLVYGLFIGLPILALLIVVARLNAVEQGLTRDRELALADIFWRKSRKRARRRGVCR